MTDLSAFPITIRWPAQHPDRLQLYSLPTPNGVKVSIMLEEVGLAYEPHLIDIMANETWGPEYLSLNPNGKIPAILDPDGPNGQPLALFESGAILIYLAEKTQVEFDCEAKKARVLATIDCAGRMCNGKVVYSDADASEWTAVGANTLGELEWKAACIVKEEP